MTTTKRERHVSTRTDTEENATVCGRRGQVPDSQWFTASDFLRRRRREPAKNTDLKKKTGDRHGKRKKQLEKYKQALGHGFAVPPCPPLDSSNGGLLLPVCVALAGGQSYTSLNNNICLKRCKALYSADFASLCGSNRQAYSARTLEGLRRYSARTPQVLRNYSMNPIAIVVWYRSMLSHNSTHQSLRDLLLGRNFHPRPASFSARVPHEIATRHRSTEQLPSWPRCSTASV